MFQIEALDQLRSRAGRRLLVGDRDPGRLFGLETVRADQGRSAVALVVDTAPRIDQHRNPPLLRRREQRGEQVRREEPLFVVGDEDRLGRGGGERRLHPLQSAVLPFLLEGTVLFPIDAEHLLATATRVLDAAEHPRLRRGRPIRADKKTRVRDAKVAKPIGQGAPRRVVADQTADRDLRPENHEVLHHRARTARAMLAVAHAQHRHRRLRRDAGDVPPQILIEDEIPDHEQSRGAEFVQRRQAHRASSRPDSSRARSTPARKRGIRSS